MTGYTFSELTAMLGSATRAKAMMRWLYRGPGRMLPEALPARIPGVSHHAMSPVADRLVLPRLTLTQAHKSDDGTVKLLLDAQGAPFETVVIPTERRTTVCVSSQSGCVRGCDFCATAKMGLGRNLTAAEIVAQVVHATTWAPEDVPVRNVVFMGMGEPMDNLDEVIKAIDILTEDSGLGLGGKYITVSSVGVLPRMAEFLRRSPARLAISLNATENGRRDALMPINRRYPLEEVIAFIRENATEARPILVAYIMMAGLNDTDADADRLARLLGGLPVRLNLIPLNPYPSSPYRRPTPERVMAFQRRLIDHRLTVFTRATRGDEIAAACGQLNRAEVQSPRRMQPAPPRV